MESFDHKNKKIFFPKKILSHLSESVENIYKNKLSHFYQIDEIINDVNKLELETQMMFWEILDNSFIKPFDQRKDLLETLLYLQNNDGNFKKYYSI